MINFKRLIRLAKNHFIHLPKAIIAKLYFGTPNKDLKIIMVSGTDGKTTTANMIYHLIKTSGKSVGLISTISAKWPSGQIPTGLHVTNPSSWQLYKLIKQMRRDKIQYLVLEVTSHGIDQFRIWGLKPYIYVLTNITPEHLDYHPSFDHYITTKLKPTRQARYVVFNLNDPTLAKHLKTNRHTFSVSHKPSTQTSLVLKLIKTNHQDHKALISVTTPKTSFKTLTPLPQPYNLTNLGLAIQTSLLLHISPKDIQKATASLPPIKGRLETIDTHGQNFKAFVDFAHTPAALDQVLHYLKKLKTSSDHRLIAVFGSAGLRDKSKRPLLVKSAARHADIIILTAEDPRTEEVTDIIKQMEEGFPTTWKLADHHKPPNQLKKRYFIIPDRKQAIEFAITKLVKEGDVVGFFGKGHEQSMCYGTTELPWDEIKEVKKAILKKLYQNHITGVVLAAGKGTRIASLTKNKINKAMVPVLGKPMVGWAKDLLAHSHINHQIYVVGYKAAAIKQYLGSNVTYVTQTKQLGTGDAIKHVIPVLSNKIRHVLVINADQAFYQPEILQSFINHYLKGQYDAAVLSTHKDNPTGLGRIVRDNQGNLMAIIEERDADPETKKIKEINTGTYVFNKKFLEKYIDQLPLHTDKNEYYLTDIFAIALKDSPPPKIGVLQINNPLVNLGFNTPEQLQQGERILKKFYPELSL